MKNVSILDCTLRDGGYYTQWDFDQSAVDIYIQAVNKLPIDFVEIGYRSKPMDEYMGEYFYCPDQLMAEFKSHCIKKLAIIINEKDVRAADVATLLKPCVGNIELIRLAIDPTNYLRAISLAKAIKKMGFAVAFNVMYMSTWKSQTDFLNNLELANEVCDYFYMVDSFGGVYPEDVRELFAVLAEKLNVAIGFHGHNNLELALINTLTAIECGVQVVDATITGMGRGAGNLKTELLLAALNGRDKNFEVDFNPLSKVVDVFTKLQENYGWGTSLPYMVSGANSLPQKEVMDWVGKRYYSFNSIIRALHNQSKGVKDNLQLPKLDYTTWRSFKKAIIIGGGPTIKQHAKALKTFIGKEQDILIIHASSKNAMMLQGANTNQLFCLVGNEGHRLEEVFEGNIDDKGICILPPFPRKMGTYIPSKLRDKAFELSEVSFTEKAKDSHTAIALQTALDLNISEVFVAGYDGYSGNEINMREHELFLENEELFQLISAQIKLIALTPTQYQELNQNSVYAWL